MLGWVPRRPRDRTLMRWFPFLLLTILLLTAQSALAPRLAVFGARPDWLLITVVFLALFAMPRQAVVGAWVLGACADLMTVERFGLMAVSYGLTALFVSSIRELLFRNRGVTQVCVTWVASLLVCSGWMVYHRLLYPPATSVLHELSVQVMLASFYTAAWSPLIMRALLGVARPLGISLPRYSYAGLHRLRTGDV